MRERLANNKKLLAVMIVLVIAVLGGFVFANNANNDESKNTPQVAGAQSQLTETTPVTNTSDNNETSVNITESNGDESTAITTAASRPAATANNIAPAPQQTQAPVVTPSAPQTVPTESQHSGNNDNDEGTVVAEPSFEVVVHEDQAFIDDYGQVILPFEVTFKDSYIGSMDRPFLQPQTVFVSGPDGTAMSPTTMFSKDQPNWPNIGINGFVGFVVYEHAAAGDYTWELTITDGTVTAKTNLVVSLVAQEA
jgi:hypothetical protein